MKITVKLFASFRQGRFKVQEYEFEDAKTCADIAAMLDISEEEIGVIMVNGRHAPLSRPLQDAETLALFPLVGGG